MEINAEQNLLWEAKFRRQKIGWDKNKFGELSAEEIQEITDNVVAVKTKTNHKVGNENIQRYVSVKFISLKGCKISHMNIEILRIHEDYVTNVFFSNLQELNVFLKSFCTSSRKKHGTLLFSSLKWILRILALFSKSFWSSKSSSRFKAVQQRFKL